MSFLYRFFSSLNVILPGRTASARGCFSAVPCHTQITICPGFTARWMGLGYVSYPRKHSSSQGSIRGIKPGTLWLPGWCSNHLVTSSEKDKPHDCSIKVAIRTFWSCAIWYWPNQYLLQKGFPETLGNPPWHALLYIHLLATKLYSKFAWIVSNYCTVFPTEQLQITCAADCVSSRKIVNATLYLSASFTFQPTCKATISCDSGYKNTTVVRVHAMVALSEFIYFSITQRKCYYDPKFDLSNKWTWNIPPSAVNCTVKVDVLSRSGSTPRMRSCSFLCML